MEFLLYGANGYTGQLIAENAERFGIVPVLAGRSEEKIKPLAKRLGYDYKIFALEEINKLDAALKNVNVVLNAAGPFQHTARPVMEACIRTQTHYLDITGEIPVFELAAGFDQQAKDAGILIMSGVGFDVVPTDCLALFLKKQLPDATHLKLAFYSSGGVSHGTAMTMAENLGEGSAVRKNGKIIKVPLGHKTMWIPFDEDKERLVMTIPWGDVSTAYYSTGIPNIETYSAVKPSTYKKLRWQKFFNWLLRLPFVRAIIKRQVSKRTAGPSEEKLKNSRSYVWGEVKNALGQTKQAKLNTPNGYWLTMLTSLTVLKKVLNGKKAELTGFQTPAGGFSEDLIMQIESVERHNIIK